jgi:branched-chain amino acid transport system substrate-binding protein
VDNERELSKEFHIALDALLPPAPWLEAAVRQHLRRERPGRRPADRITLRLPANAQRVVAVLVLIVLTAAATGVFLVAHHAFMVPAGSKGTIVIGSDEAASGADTWLGQPIQYGEAFAVAQAGSVRGFTLRFAPYDDSVNGNHDATQGAQNVVLMASDRRLLGIIASFSSGTTAVQIPIANAVQLAMIGPINTNECLTMPLAYCQDYAGYTAAGLRPNRENNYFRIAAADTFQGPAMADFAYDTLGLKTIAVWDDQFPFGMNAANGFAAEFNKKGGSVVARQSFDTRSTSGPDFHPWLLQAKAAGAQAIYAGATSASYGCAPRGASLGIFDANSYYLGPDGIGDAQCLKDAGAMANNHMYASLGIGDANLNPSAAATIAAYIKVHPNPSDNNEFTFAGYDSAAILIDAIGRAIDASGGKMPTRQQVVTQLGRTNYQGLTGIYTFNANGDPTMPTLQIQQNQGGTWTPIKNITVAGS